MPNPAADIGCADAHARRRHMEDVGEHITDSVYAGAADDQMQTAVVRSLRSRRAFPSRRSIKAVIDHLDRAYDMRGMGQRGFRHSAVAFLKPEGDVAWGVLPQGCGARFHRGDRINNGGQRIRTAHRPALRHHAPAAALSATTKATGSPTMTHAVCGQSGPRRHDHRRHRWRPVAVQGIAEVVSRKIGRREDTAHAGHAACRAVSIESITACACGDRTTTTCSMPGRMMSSMIAAGAG